MTALPPRVAATAVLLLVTLLIYTQAATLMSDRGATAIAAIRTCIPDTLGSEYARRTQIWEYTEGRLTQPYAGGDTLCLTTTTLQEVQGAPALVMDTCGGALATNQSWQLNADSQVVLAGTNECLDVAGYQNASGSPLHLWRCADVPAVFPAKDANERWIWRADGTVRSAMSGLCLDVGGSDTRTKTCEMPAYNNTAFCNKSLSPAARAAALVQAANATQRIANLAVGGQSGVPGLGVPPLSFSEALHGVACGCVVPAASNGSFQSTGCPTSFPNALGLASSYNQTLWSLVGTVIGTEARALHNRLPSCGLGFFTPNINLYRDPRWGRGMETPGEDPLTAGAYAAAYVGSMASRSADGRTQRVIVGPKHFVDYDMEGRHDRVSPGWGPSRNDFDAVVAKQEQVEFFLPAWHAAVSIGRAGGVMCSTNRVNGVDACMNPTYLNGFLRQRFGFEGYVVTDGNSCGNPNCEATVAAYNATAGWGTEGHQIAAKLCLRGGTDIELGQTLLQYTAGALEEGEVSDADVSGSNTKVFEQFIQAGWLDKTVNDDLGAADVDTEEHRRLAFDAAVDGMVLLKNDGGLLPLLNRSVKVALVGPHVNSTTSFLSNYHGQNTLVANHSVEAALRAVSGINLVGSAPACDISSGCQWADISSVKSAVEDAEVVLAFVGLYPTSGAPTAKGYGKPCSESESWDRGDILLCGQQGEILKAAASTGRAKLVVVLVNGGTIASRWIKENATSVLEAWYPGQAGGQAIAAVLLGDRAPTGRLPVTIYDEGFVSDRGEAGNITNMSLRENGGITYMHYQGEPLWPFGFGLSYTRWNLSVALSPATISTAALASAYANYYSPPRKSARHPDGDDPLVLSASVANLGSFDSPVVVQVFATALPPVWRGNGTQPPLAPPVRQLVGFAREHVPEGTTVSVAVPLAPAPLCPVGAQGNQWAAPGAWRLSVTVDGQDFETAELQVTGPAQMTLEWPRVD